MSVAKNQVDGLANTDQRKQFGMKAHTIKCSSEQISIHIVNKDAFFRNDVLSETSSCTISLANN